MRKIKKFTLILLTLLVLTGCGASKSYVSYTIYPIGYLLNRIAGDKIKTISVQESDLIEVAQVKQSDEEKGELGLEEILKNSIYFFHIPGLEPYMDVQGDVIYKTEVKEIDLSELNAIYKFQRYTRVSADGNDTYIESPYYNGDAMEMIDTYDYDLFLWLDPIGMLSMAKDICEVLSNNNVEQSAFYHANYDNLESDLISLDASYQELSTKLKNDSKVVKFVCMTPSFGSWQKSYGIQVYPVCLSKYGTLPTEEQLQIIKDRIIKDDVRYIAYEPNMTQEMSQLFSRLESELELTRVNLSNISSLSSSQISDNKDYLSLMYENLAVLENIAVKVETTTVE